MKDLISQLLAPEKDAHPETLLGADVFIRRLTAHELNEFDEQLEQLVKDKDQRGQSLLTISLILRALVDENGIPVPADELPAPDVLLKCRSNASILQALRTIQRHSWGTLEEAKKN